MEILKKISTLKKELDSFRPLDKETEARIMQKFRLDWNYHSNHIEGNTLTYGETKALILFGITAKGKPLKDHIEMTGHDDAVKWIESILKEERPITEKFIRDLHTLLLKESYASPIMTPDGIRATKKVKVGEYKTQQNNVKTITGEMYYFASPKETIPKMGDLIKWFREKKKQNDAHSLLVAAEFHYKFIRIHPFDDGNGRTARILMNFILMQAGYPPVIIKTEDRTNYIAALRQADVGLLEPFIEYIGENLERSLKLMLKGAKGESIEEMDDVDKEIALLEQRLKGEKAELETVKSKEILLKTFENSLFGLIKLFFKSAAKFDGFYQTSFLNVIYRVKETDSLNFSFEKLENEVREAKYTDFELLISFLKSILSPISYLDFDVDSYIVDLSFLKIEYKYSDFNRKGYGNFSHTSGFNMKFNRYNYVISDLNENIFIKKDYDETLSIQEIQNLIRNETKAHTKFIEQQIEKSKNT